MIHSPARYTRAHANSPQPISMANTFRMSSRIRRFFPAPQFCATKVTAASVMALMGDMRMLMIRRDAVWAAPRW